MKKRFRQHVNPLKMTAMVPREAPLSLEPGRPVEAELGCGDAHFLIQRAEADPDTTFVGLDIRDEFLQVARNEVERRGLTNVTLCTTNLIVDSDRLFVPDQVRRVFVNFPDPWFKARHANRRWFNATSLSHLVDALCPGGQLCYQTDVWDLAIEALGLLEADPTLRNRAGEWTFIKKPPFPQRTNRERACLAEGKRIWRMLFDKPDVIITD